ncbi:uncharacterized protein LOC132731632, partial [Ruditapes philippinarum]|uniref:uncharacterized protein LOC132731632 n=1 Tax=Ruditapes philippinarum TaxID=129788 RepID=UPI00295BB02D
WNERFDFFYQGYVVHSATSFKTERGVYRFTIELLIVADYSEFNKWYQLTSASLSHSQRVNEATEKVKQYAAALIHSSNNVYRSLELHSIYIDIKLVDVLVMT